ncbi:hypothetical protein OAA60_01950 [Porticoccaceae bacterium]|jgi:hypothetical protein|nr:hypothetical protein [Porticoccaceae bacterium]
MEIRDSNIVDGKGLFTTKSVKKNDVLFVLSGNIYSEPSRETIYIGNNQHIYDEYGIFINHSFTPNIVINNKNVVALVNISANEEVAFNYNDSEPKMAAPFSLNGVMVNGNDNIK